MPKSALKCIETWKKFLPDYEIKEWNEDNFDVNIIPYTAQAYAARKWAFVSDYVRMWALYHEGGVYFDTDVEVIRPLDGVLERGDFMGIETSDGSAVAPGLGLALKPHDPICKEILDRFEAATFNPSRTAGNGIVTFTTDALKAHGYRVANELQEIDGITIYPQEYFNPYDYVNGRLNTTPRTLTIHWYTATWMSGWKRMKLNLGRVIRRMLNR